MGCNFECDCVCDSYDDAFDEIMRRETRFSLRLKDILCAPYGWYSDRSVDDSQFSGWFLPNRTGLYFLWEKNDVCPKHDRYHMRALYVGKGTVDRRLLDHWAEKETSDVILVYFSMLEMENRIAKYIEQLLLDIYAFPLNKSENRGKKLLCAHREEDPDDPMPWFAFPD